jgi:hypothetical protein
MAYETLVVRDELNNARTGSRSVTIFVRQGQQVKMAEVVLEKGEDAAKYAEAQADTLFKDGTTPEAKVSATALFEATKARNAEQYYLKVIFQALRQLKLGGGLSDMVVAGRQALGEDDVLLAEWQAFEQAYKDGSDEDRLTLNAMATWTEINLLVALGLDRK